MIKRPLALAGATVLASQAVALFSPTDIKTALCAIVLALLVYVLIAHRKKTGYVIFLSCILLTLGINTVYMQAAIEPSRQLDGETVLIMGKVVKEPEEQYSRSYYVIETSSIALDGAPQKIKLRLSSRNSLELEVGDTLKAQVSFNSFDELENYSRLRLLSDGVSATAFISPHAEYSVERGSMSGEKLIVMLRNEIRSVLRSSMPEDVAALSIAVLLGDKSGLERSTVTDFRICGISHLLAVSGLHVSIIAAFALYLMRRFGLGHKASALACIPVILLYMALTGFSSSAVRAGIMSIISMLAVAIDRDYDAPSALGAALIIMCLSNPCAAGDVGLLLSAGCTAGLVFILPQIYKNPRYKRLTEGKSRKAKIKRAVISAVTVSVTASLCALPITVLVFEETSVISPLSNLLCVMPATFLLTVVSILCLLALVPFIGQALGIAVGALACVPARYLIIVSSLLADIPGASVSAGEDYMPALVLASAVVASAWYVLFSKKKHRKRMLIFAVAVIVQMTIIARAVDTVFAGSSPTAVVYNVEGGLGIALRSGGNTVLLGSGGDEYMAFEMSYDLRMRSGGKIDAVFYPTDDEEYTSYALDIIEELGPDAVFLPQTGSRSELIAARANDAGCSLYDVGDGSCTAGDITVRGYTDENGGVWLSAMVDGMSVLVCPPNGDCLLLPDEISHPDCAVLLGGKTANVTGLKATAVIVCADFDDSALIKQQLQARGIRNIFCPSIDGTVELGPSSTGIMIRTE